MGSSFEFNDTIKATRESGMLSNLKAGERYRFVRPGRRLFHLSPGRVFLVEEIDGKWNFLGQARVLEFTIDAENEETRGVFEVVKLYTPEHSRLLNEHEAPAGKGWCPEA